ncbi:MAG: PIN domain-containing protein [Phreatobacter sp.]|jgi:predicted nucleic acid-binding protein|uniref:PIN domain-containing protein n=1 Tax=Phreatobacter sp. TaxID=1966341 RepID=UPI0040369E65
MKPGKAFIDTNVLIYLAAAEEAKADRAEELLRAGGIVSVQVLNEFVSVARRKTALRLEDIRTILDVVRGFCEVTPLDLATHDLALDICGRFGLSIDDSLIVAAAARAGATTLWTEDLQHGQTIAGVTIANPFTA